MSSLEFTNIFVETSKILELHIGNVCTEVKLGSNVDTAIKGLEGGPDMYHEKPSFWHKG
jgi:hypothetical protein